MSIEKLTVTLIMVIESGREFSEPFRCKRSENSLLVNQLKNKPKGRKTTD